MNAMAYLIPNCGKGQPMQTKKLGNGGPMDTFTVKVEIGDPEERWPFDLADGRTVECNEVGAQSVAAITGLC